MGHVYNLKQFKVQTIGILEEIDSFYWPKMHFWKGAKKLGRALPPIIGTKSKRKHFSQENDPDIEMKE